MCTATCMRDATLQPQLIPSVFLFLGRQGEEAAVRALAGRGWRLRRGPQHSGHGLRPAGRRRRLGRALLPASDEGQCSVVNLQKKVDSHNFNLFLIKLTF